MSRKRRIGLWIVVGLCVLASLCLLGGMAFLGWQWFLDRTQPENYPISASCIVVTTYHAGMPAAVIERTITNRIERWVNQAPGVKRITSKSVPGVSIVRVYFGDEIDPTGALTMTGQLALGALPTLPPNTLPPVVMPSLSQPVGNLVIHSATASDEELKQIARINVRSWLLDVEECVAPVVVGGKDRVVRIRLDPHKLEAHHLSSQNVVEALRIEKHNFVWENEHEVLVDALLDIRLLEDKEVAQVGDIAVSLRDIAHVENAPALQTALYRIDGRPAVGVPVYARNGTRPRAVAEKITKNLDSLELRIPPNVQFQWVPFGVRRTLSRTDNGLLTISVRTPSDSPFVQTEKRIAAVERFLEKYIPAEERNAILSESGRTDATISVQLSGQRRYSTADYAAKLRSLMHEESDLSDLSIRFASRDMPAPVDIRIKGGKDEGKLQLAQEIHRSLTAIQGAVDVDIAQRQDSPYLLITADGEKAKQVGLDGKAVIRQVVMALKPVQAWEQSFWTESKADNHVSASVSYHSDMNLQTALDSITIGTRGTKAIRLGELTSLQRITEAVEIDHVDLSRVLDVRANIDERNRSDVIADIRRMIQELHVPAGMKVELAE